MSKQEIYDPWRRDAKTYELDRLLKLAIWFSNTATNGEDYSFISIILAFLAARDKVSSWFQKYVKEVGIKEEDFKDFHPNKRFDAIMHEGEFNEFNDVRNIANFEIEQKGLEHEFNLDQISDRGKSTTRWRNAYLIITFNAVKLRKETIQERDKELLDVKLDVRHVLAACIYDPSVAPDSKFFLFSVISFFASLLRLSVSVTIIKEDRLLSIILGRTNPSRLSSSSATCTSFAVSPISDDI
jgi:hypothetical protein